MMRKWWVRAGNRYPAPPQSANNLNRARKLNQPSQRRKASSGHGVCHGTPDSDSEAALWRRAAVVVAVVPASRETSSPPAAISTLEVLRRKQSSRMLPAKKSWTVDSDLEPQAHQSHCQQLRRCCEALKSLHRSSSKF